MDPDKISQLLQENPYYLIIGGTIFGLVLGLIPLIVAIKRGMRGLGLIALVVCGVCGAFMPLLAIIDAIVFTLLIVIKSRSAKNGEA